MDYPEMPAIDCHGFVSLLQFGTTFELMEFLALQQIEVSQRMVEDHVETQMIERALEVE